MAELPLPAGLNASTFPAKLWRLVNSPRVCSLRWDSQARGLLIDRSLFERELLSQADAHGDGGEGAGAVPDSFQATHFSSFVYQLNLYGFQKVPGRVGATLPGDAGGWLHFRNPNFRRDRPDLLLRIKRLTRANRQRLAAALEVRSRLPSRFQQLHTDRSLPAFPAGQPSRGTLSNQDLRAASPEHSELPPGPFRQSPGPQESEVFLASPKKALATSGLPGVSSEEPDTRKYQLKHELIIPLFCMDLKRHPELIVQLVRVDHHSTSKASSESSSCTSSQQQQQYSPAKEPSATPGISAPSAPAGSAGSAAWTAPSWVWNSPGEEELPLLDLDLVLETLEEMLSPSLPERSPSAQVNISVAPESSGAEPVNKAAAEGALPGAVSYGNSSQEPEELDILLICLTRRAALRGKKDQRESL